MNIFVDARSLLEPQPSGVSVYTRALLSACVQAFPQHHFTLFTNAVKNVGLPEEYQHRPNVSIVKSRFPNKLLHISFSLFGAPALSRFVEPHDVYFFPNVLFLPRLPHPSVVTIHDLSHLHASSLLSSKSRVWHSAVRFRRIICQADILVVDSFATASAVKLSFPDKEHAIRVVPLALANSHSANLRIKKSHILVLGDLHERKNIEGILVAYQKARELGYVQFPLCFIGKRSHGTLSRSTQKIFSSLKKRGWVKEYGYVSDDAKKELLRSAAALMFISLYEGFGFPILEAQSYGIPVIASASTSLPEVGGRGVYYVDPSNISQIIMSLKICAEHHWEYPIVAHTAGGYAGRTWEMVAQDMEHIFTSVTSIK